MNRRIAVVTSSRADLSILSRLIEALESDPEFELFVIATGMHNADDASLRSTITEGTLVHLTGTDLGSGAAGAAHAMGRILSESSNALETISPDLLIVTGDRLDMAPVAMAAVPFNIPLMHLHGGELTYGAVDDRLRHALTKLAHVHCAATDKSASRIIAMGEEPWRVHVTGAPALDSLSAVPIMGASEFASSIGLAEIDQLCLVTVHTETNSADPTAPARAVFDALSRDPGKPILVTAPNSDPGSERIASMIQDFIASTPGARYVATLGTALYANAMRYAAVMVGNSSSGILEAGLFGLPVVNVGDRQAGRERGKNVENVAANAFEISRAILAADARPRQLKSTTPYGDGAAVPRIVEILKGLPDRRPLLEKRWHTHAA